MKNDCIFCKIINGEVPAHKIWEDEKHLAILDIFPNTPGFTVVLTKEHKNSYFAAEKDTVITDLVKAAKKVALLLDRAFEDVGRTALMFEGYGVDHLHCKLFPMHGTKDAVSGGSVEVGQGVFFEKYPGFITSQNANRANDEELAELAKKIRNSV